VKTDGCVENTQRRTTAQRTAENAITGPNGPVLLTLSDPFRIAGCLFCLRALMLVLEAAEPADKYIRTTGRIPRRAPVLLFLLRWHDRQTDLIPVDRSEPSQWWWPHYWSTSGWMFPCGRSPLSLALFHTHTHTHTQHRVSHNQTTVGRSVYHFGAI